MLSSGQQNVVKFKKRSILKHILLIVILVNLSEAGLYLSPFGNGHKRPIMKDEFRTASERMNDYCLSPECIHAASRALNYMDSNVDPCDNFYKFACGNFLETTQVPDDKVLVDAFSSINDEIQKQMKMFLEQKSKPTDPKHAKLVKNFYQSCMNTTGINKQSLPLALDLLKKIGGWPLLEGDAWSNASFQWELFLSTMKNVIGSSSRFFPSHITLDMKNNSRLLLEINQPTFSGASSDDYYNYLIEIAVIFGADKVKVEQELKEIHKIEMDIKNITVPDKETRNEEFYWMTVKELQGNYSNILWKEYFNVILSPYNKIGDDEVVQVKNRSFFKRFNELIARISKRDQANYIIWKLIENKMTDYLNDDVQKAKMKLTSASTGQKEMTPRWKVCYNSVSSSLEYGISAAYIKNFFNKEYKKDVSQIVNNILQQFEINFKNNKWLDNKTKELALEKVRAMYTHVAYADELVDGKKIDEYYQELEIVTDNFLQSYVNISKFDNQFVEIYRKVIDLRSWKHRENSVKVNARYHPNSNSIEILAGILQGAFFNNRRPKYMNYGTIGTVIGHEITHNFDSQGSNYDKKGNVFNWWTPEAKKQFLLKAQCIIDQYGNFTAEEVGLHLKGFNTQEENIADNGGVKIAYLAYKKWAKNHKSEPLLPGLKYTQSQLFWISHAQAWCKKVLPKKLMNDIKYDFHSPAEFRVLGTFRNQPEFSRDFKCAQGTKMNPEKKCSVW